MRADAAQKADDGSVEQGEPEYIKAPANPEADAFYAAAEKRAVRFIVVLSVITTVLVGVHYGGAVAIGFALGCAAALVNFFWLKRVVAGFTAAAVHDPKRPSAGLLVFRYLVRFALITFAAFAIFKGSKSSGYGFLAGLFVPVAALMCEAAYEAWVAIRRKL
jgi:hypothetical protein